MRLTRGTIVAMTSDQAESLTTLVDDQIEDLRHLLKDQHPDEWLTVRLIQFITHYRNIRRTLKDLHYINPPTMLINKMEEMRGEARRTGVFFR